MLRKITYPEYANYANVYAKFKQYTQMRQSWLNVDRENVRIIYIFDSYLVWRMQLMIIKG